MSTLTGAAKLEEVTKLMERLSADLQKISLLPHRESSAGSESPGLTSAERDAYLEQLKVFGRDPTNAEPIFTKEGIEVLTRHAFNSPSRTTSRNALRCLANALLLKPETRQIFVDLKYESKVCKMLQNDSRDDEFLVSRIIFLATYNTTLDLQELIDKYHLAETICTNIGRYTIQYTTKQKKVKELNPMEDMALTESLKLLFNITHFCPQRNGHFSSALPHILLLLVKRPISGKTPLDQVISPLVNSVINLNLDTRENLAIVFPKTLTDIHTDRLVEILDKSTNAYSDEELDQVLAPLLTLVRKVYALAPAEVQIRLQRTLLPSNDDRQQVLGKGSSLPSRLLRLCNNPSTPQTRESVSSFLFELSNKDATTFVHNVGYGFAAGFLFQHKVPIPENATDAWSTSESSSSRTRESQDSINARRVNPITGQFLNKEKEVPEVEMTEDEKEREAERLFVLFERLKKTGVMNVENPVTKAFHEGRFEELDDDAN